MFDSTTKHARAPLTADRDRYSETEGDLEWVDYGLSIFARDIAGEIPRDQPADLADLFGRLSREGRLAGYEVGERFYEIGSPEGLAELERLLDSR